MVAQSSKESDGNGGIFAVGIIAITLKFIDAVYSLYYHAKAPSNDHYKWILFICALIANLIWIGIFFAVVISWNIPSANCDIKK